jgi:oligoribonuclease NrnB/cAMP/cGMP phosphodiesterase (DHH superfamily)
MSLPVIPDIKNAHLVTHGFCMDGATCCILWEAAGGKRENVHFVPAGGVERFIKKNRVIASPAFLVFADVGLTSPTQADVLEKRGNCVLIDHHATSQHLSDRHWCDVRMDACGSELLRQYLGLDDEFIKMFVEIVDDHDRWLGKHAISTDLAMWLVFSGQDDFIKRFSVVRHPDASPTMASLFERFTDASWLTMDHFWTPFESELMQILRQNRDRGIQSALRRAVVVDIEHPWDKSPELSMDIVVMVTSEQNSGLLLHQALEEHPEAKVSCQVNVDKGSVSLRSRGDYDVASMAKYFGGGGHKAAAGFSIPDDFIDSTAELVFA